MVYLISQEVQKGMMLYLEKSVILKNKSKLSSEKATLETWATQPEAKPPL